MQKFIVLIFISLLFGGRVFAYNHLSETYNQSDMQNLSRAEYAVLGQNNRNLPPQARLNLTEQRLFGTTQTGSFQDRVNFINRVIQNNTRNQTFANINNIKKRNKILYALNEIFNGTMTGYTPSFQNYPTYSHNTNNPYYYHNTRIPQPYGSGIGNFITQTRIIIDEN